jgi:serine phosphatase RsbU (regulator of sigma subunit)
MTIAFYILLSLLAAMMIAGVILYRRFPMHLIYKSKIHLQTMFDSMENPVAIVDDGYIVKRVNKAYATLVGRTYWQILGNKCHAVLRGRETPCEDCQMKAVQASGKTAVVEHSPHPSVPEGVISFSFYPFSKKHERDGAIVEHIRDITQLERLKQQLENQYSEIKQANTKLQEFYARTEEELAIARQIQLGIMPQTIPQITGLKIDAMYHSIEAVGGDLYDFIPFSDNKLGIFIGDASGHGLASAFIGTISKMLLYSHTKTEKEADVLLHDMNRDLLRNILAGYYLTAFWGIFDNADNSFSFSRAGHPRPYHIPANGAPATLQSNGTFIGILEQAAYERKKIILNKGDRLYFFTDGIYEVMGEEAAPGALPSEGMLGYRRFLSLIEECNTLPFEKIIPAIKQNLAQYVYDDDYTLIVVEITRNPGSA